jgi:geranylgeranyl pyrophosphate synthase
MNNPPFEVFAQNCLQNVNHTLDELLPSQHTTPAKLHQAMRYATLSQGKRIRPLLVYACAEVFQIDQKITNVIAAAIECIHCYSLIHDDLPAMDDDDLRRGQPTCHKKYDEATAILAGDALQTFAFYLISHHLTDVTAEAKVLMIEKLSIATGSRGMAGGQAIDIEHTNSDITLPELENMHIHKTGALIRASVILPTLCCLGNSTQDMQQHLDQYAKCVGLAFQIHDDILDVEQSTQQLGKTSRKDIAQFKSTYPSLLGLSEAKDKRHALYQQALNSLSTFSTEANHLRQIAELIVTRQR